MSALYAGKLGSYRLATGLWVFHSGSWIPVINQWIGQGGVWRLGYTNPPPPSLATITVTPNPATVAQGGTQLFTAQGFDSVGNPVTFTPTWSASGGHGDTIDPDGTFTAGASSHSGIVTASCGGISGTASYTVP